MAREVDIWWEDGGRLKASLRWTNKRGRISFILMPAGRARCEKCPFKGNLICSKWREPENNKRYNPGHRSMLWGMKGDNKFERRNRIFGWQPLGPLGREKKKE